MSKIQNSEGSIFRKGFHYCSLGLNENISMQIRRVCQFHKEKIVGKFCQESRISLQMVPLLFFGPKRQKLTVAKNSAILGKFTHSKLG
ncbi:unnamed protein product [Acanthoscelides obtectus]|uniref:Uncharacterized protein n=1 Tax=Acanthoscelides obtectus TaxID=200917 RepID=A0A9P0MIL5_ACAOB|nr:unnamed protein product [Acanthoscelides obtectus]CAK1676578.1 hypothetical protein AOBTE_LOCUS30832 [Acanthoscelides obtectus]